jgi:hypothetical protein
MSLLNILAEKSANLSTVSKYTAFNGLIYLGLGVVLVLWPSMVQTLLRDRAFMADEQGLMRALGLTIGVIGWLYLFGGRAGARQTAAASVIDRLIFVPLVALPLAFAGVFPHLFVVVTITDMSLAVGAWMLLRADARSSSVRTAGRAA